MLLQRVYNQYLPVSSVVAKWDLVLHTKMQSEPHDPSVVYHNHHQEEDPLLPLYHRYQAKALPRIELKQSSVYINLYL